MYMKTKRLTRGALSIALLVGALPVASGAVQEASFRLESTMDLYELCSVSSDVESFATARYACRGFIEGVVQYHDAISDNKTYKRLICYPSTATIADARNAFVAWVAANNDDKKLMQKMPVVGLVRSLAEKYPCSK
jgi:hypothetical protein